MIIYNVKSIKKDVKIVYIYDCFIVFNMQCSTIMIMSRQTLTLGRLKDSSLINSLAYSLQPMFPTVHYLYSDFKKNKGIDLSLQCKEKYSIYAQCYCGCEKYDKKD